MLAEVRSRFRCQVFFLYLHEAHARDFWPLSPSAPPVHADLAERLAAASSFLEGWPSLTANVDRSYVDDMSNELALEYGLWPERVVLLKHGCAVWASDFEEYGEEELLDAAGRVFASPGNTHPLRGW